MDCAARRGIPNLARAMKDQTPPMIRSSILLLVGYIGLSLLSAGLVYNNTLRTELTALNTAGEVRLDEAANRFRLQIDGFRAQANLIAETPRLAQALSAERGKGITDFLKNFTLKYGALRIDLFSEDRVLIASSSAVASIPTPSRALMQAALNERLGFELAFEDGHRVVRLSRRVTAPNTDSIGAVVLTIDVAELEFQWPVTPEPVVFFDDAKLSFAANRPELLFLSKGNDPEQAAFNLRKNGRPAEFQTWSLTLPNLTEQTVLAPSRMVPHLQLSGQIFLDVAPVRATALLRAALVATLALVLGLLVAVALQQRRRFALEALHSATLEDRVDARTAELRTAQDELVATSKLAALGRLSAGVSHELNQPLGAILNYSQNARKFLEKNAQNRVEENLSHITGQVQRITRIIGNLRAFARQDTTPTERIDFVDVTRAALDLMRNELEGGGISAQISLPTEPIYIVAGRVRLEQVILNLLSNAADAMSEVHAKQLGLQMSVRGGQATLTVQDNGTGIADPDRVFEPFYTTKDLGASRGLGMGLALSFGIVTRFHGALTCRNLNPGAEFQITLPLAEKEDA